MNITCISDTHGYHETLKEKLHGGDMIIHAGDCSHFGSLEANIAFLKWFNELPYRFKIMVAGNHDFAFQLKSKEFQSSLKNTEVIYLEDSYVTLDGFTVFGSPWTVGNNGWAFEQFFEYKIEEIYASTIPSNQKLDIIVSHAPLKGYMDVTKRQGNTGPVEIHYGTDAMLGLVEKKKPRLVVFGHVHNQYGKSVMENGTTLVNASIFKGTKMPLNDPIIIDLK